MQYRLGSYRGKWTAIWIEESQTRRASLNASIRTTPWKDADVLFKQWVARETAASVAGNVTVGTCLDSYFEAKIGKVEYRSKLVDYFRSYMPGQVNQVLCDAYTETRVGRAPSTIRDDIGILKTALIFAKNNKLIPEVPYFQLPPGSPPRDVWKTKEEIDRLIEATKTPHIRMAMLLMRYTGARSGAVCSLPWDRVSQTHIDFNDPMKPSSRKKRAYVPISPGLLPALQEGRRGAVTPFVIEYGGKQVASIKKAFARAAENAGLPEVTPHVLRHSVATWMAMAGRSYAEIATFLGNSVKMVEKVYAKYTPGYLAGAVDAISGTKVIGLTQTKAEVASSRRGQLVQLNQNSRGKRRTS